MTHADNVDQTQNAYAAITTARNNLRSSLVGLESLIDRLLVALLTGGHVLIEGPPGVAKTKTIRLFAAQFDLSFSRIQATPDLLPSDITGTDIYQQKTAEFTFLKGPLFHQLVLFDEVNRAPPKVQSALLEAMGEQQITTGGVTRPLARPFLVAATQNPLEHEGTYPLPEAQLDRFMFFVNIDLPDGDRERQILDQVLSENANIGIGGNSPPVTSRHDLLAAQQAVNNVHISEAIRDYIVRLTQATRDKHHSNSNKIMQAASPRASINLAMAAKAQAWISQRDFVQPDDVKELASDIYTGRIALTYRARAEGLHNRQIVDQIVNSITCL